MLKMHERIHYQIVKDLTGFARDSREENFTSRQASVLSYRNIFDCQQAGQKSFWKRCRPLIAAEGVSRGSYPCLRLLPVPVTHYCVCPSVPSYVM
jgi:hypothetical protein